MITPFIHALFFRRKRGEKGPPLVVDELWPTKKPRVNGSRKKRSVQIQMQTEPVLQVLIQSEPEPVLQLVVHSEDVLVQSDVVEAVLEVGDGVEPVLDLMVQSDANVLVADGLVDAAEPAGHDKVQKKWGPSVPGMKFRSVNKLCNVEPSSAKKSGKKQKH